MIIDIFPTPLGIVELKIFCGKNFAVSESNSSTTIIQSMAASIEIIGFKNICDLREDSIYPVDETKGWIIRIFKNTHEDEQITVTCALKTDNSNIISGPDSGEHLDAVTIQNNTCVLSIGTEDGEILKSRAEREDYMPKRFTTRLGYSADQWSFTDYLPLGFKTSVPRLYSGGCPKSLDSLFFYLSL